MDNIFEEVSATLSFAKELIPDSAFVLSSQYTQARALKHLNSKILCYSTMNRRTQIVARYAGLERAVSKKSRRFVTPVDFPVVVVAFLARFRASP